MVDPLSQIYFELWKLQIHEFAPFSSCPEIRKFVIRKLQFFRCEFINNYKQS